MSPGVEREREVNRAAHLRGHPVAEVQNWNIVRVWALVQTQLSLQGVLQLQTRQGQTQNTDTVR